MIPAPNSSNKSIHGPTWRWAFCLAVCAIFVLPGLALLPYAGIQNDEALFSTPLYAPGLALSTVSIFRHRVPTMILSYMGALKTWIYWPIFALWAPSRFSLRVPMLIAGLVTILLFYKLLEATLGSRAAMAGALLLATDSMFLMTTLFDWGPVALQHLLLVSGLLLTVRFWRTRAALALGGAFFCFGLAMWDKALFVWIFSGLALAAVLVFPDELKRAATLRNLAVALVSFLLGAFPLVRYNHHTRLETFRGNASLSTENLTQKLYEARFTLDGSALFGYMVYEDAAEQPKQPASAMERASLWLHQKLGDRRPNYMPAALLLAVLLIPFWWRSAARRAILFSFVAMAVAWVQMLLTRNAGGSAHHVVLLWPFPQLIVAAAFAAAAGHARRFAPALLAIAIGVMSAQNLLMTNQYLANFIRNGGAHVWSDAIFPLAKSLENTSASGRVWIADWGLMDSLRLLERGRLHLEVGWDTLNKTDRNEADRKQIEAMLSDPADIFAGHTPGEEAFPGIGERFVRMGAEHGYRKTVMSTIPDSNGRPIFEVFRFVKEESARLSR